MACEHNSQANGIRMQSSSCHKHLDYSAPLLSVRRLNEYRVTNRRTTAKVPYKLSAELSAETLRKPGAVPFTWEQSPGKPKNKEDDEISASSSRDSSPCRVDRDESRTDYLRNESAVEFYADGIVKDSGCSHEGSFINLLGSDSKMQLVLSRNTTEGNRMTSRWSRAEVRSRVQAPSSSPYRHSDIEASVSEATDVMAPTEAVATTCRVSVDGSDTTQTLARTNREARDFIMCRFLPAAKAMACDSPSNAGRRLPHETSKSLANRKLSRGPFPVAPRPPRIPVAGQKAAGKPAPLPDKEENDVSKKVCGLFSLRFRAPFLHLSPPTLFRSKKSECISLSRPGSLGNVIYDTSSGSDDEEIVVKERKDPSQERRSQTKTLGNQAASLAEDACDFTATPLNYQRTYEGGGTPNSKLYFDAVSRFSPQASSDRFRGRSVSPYRTDLSPFRESKRFSGLRRHWSDAVAYPDAASSSFETPRASVAGDSFFSRDSSPVSRGNRSSSLALKNRAGKSLNGSMCLPLAESRVAADEDVSNGNYMHASCDTSPQPVNVELGTGGTESFLVFDSSSVSNDLRAPELHSTGCSDTLSHEDLLVSGPVGWPLGISGKLLDSPGKVPPSMRWMDRETPLNVISPPLPKSPSDSWLWRALPVKVSNGSPLSNLPISPPNVLSKRHLDFSPSAVTKTASWDRTVKGAL